MEKKTQEENKNNIFTKFWYRIKSIFSKKKMIPEPKTMYYDRGVNVVVMKKDNFDKLKVNMEKMNKKIKLDNGFISVDDLSDEEIEEMIQLYNDELNELNKKIAAKQLELEKLKAENKNSGEN